MGSIRVSVNQVIVVLFHESIGGTRRQSGCRAAESDMDFFKCAIPVWEKKKENEKNTALVFQAELQVADPNSNYTVTSGPARAAKGYFRVDVVDISRFLKKGKNTVCVEVVGYNTPTFQNIAQPAFLQCEILFEDQVIAATGQMGFAAFTMPYKLQKTVRYDFQRSFTEAYDYTKTQVQKVELDILPEGKLLERGIAMPSCELHLPREMIQSFQVVELSEVDKIPETTAVQHTKDVVFSKEELEIDVPFLYAHCQEQNIDFSRNPYQASAFAEKQGKIYEFDRELSGFIRLKIEASEEYHLLLSYDEILTANHLNPFRMNSCNVISVKGPAGSCCMETLEPYSIKYIKVSVLSGSIDKLDLSVRSFENGTENSFQPEFQDEDIKVIFEAAKETYRQNAVDIFTDCPSRERAGWLCDSFFTGRAEWALTDQNSVEHNFLENILLFHNDDILPDGMLPMCYPADFPNGEFIPNWGMWFVLELEEYFNRTNNKELLALSKDKVYALWGYFKNFENEFGLLEDLKGWVFVDWSDANQHVTGVNYPSNMMYYAMLMVISRLFHDTRAAHAAEKLKQVICEKSYNGGSELYNHILSDVRRQCEENFL